MNRFEIFKLNASRVAGRSGLLLKKHSPEILMGAGVLGIVTSTVLACRATLKVDEVLDESKSKLDRIHMAKKTFNSEEYTDTDFKKDLTIAYIQTGVDFVKLYGPAITLGVASIACVLSAHGIMKRRNVALVAAYKAMEKSYTNYRQRVVEEFGEEKDRLLKNGIKQSKVTVTETDENGKEKKSKKTVEVVDPNGISEYARFFDESCKGWSPEPSYNLMFLKAQQNYANDLLKSRGHLFLNEVYDMLGIPRSKAGTVVGWALGEGDDFVDFGIFNDQIDGYANDYHMETVGEERRDFVNGYRKSILLDFNVTGVIYDLI